MSDTGLTVPDMTELPCRYDVTITVDRDSGDHPDPAEFAVAAGQAASARAASIVSAYTASQRRNRKRVAYEPDSSVGTNMAVALHAHTTAIKWSIHLS
jgi:hypothetical protein